MTETEIERERCAGICESFAEYCRQFITDSPLMKFSLEEVAKDMECVAKKIRSGT